MSIIPFVFENERVRFVGVYYDTPWWIASDLCGAMGIANTSQAILGTERVAEDGTCYKTGGLKERHVGKLVRTPEGFVILRGFAEEANYLENQNPYGARAMSDIVLAGQELEQDSYWLVNEGGLYSLILKSRKKKAERFQEWVEVEVLPTIRKTGKYELDSPDNNPEYKDSRDATEALNKRVEFLESKLKESETREGVVRIPSILPPSTPAADIPSDYIETEEGYWISPRQYQSMKNNSKKNLGWEIRQVNPKTPYNPINDKVDTDYTPYNLESTLSEEQKNKQRKEIEKLVKPISEEENQRLADMKRKARYLLDEF